MRLLWLALGLVFLGTGLVGVVLPVLPTTPFLLLAAGCLAKSSPRLHGWLLGHRTFGPPILAWEAHGAISRGAKRLAVVSMAAVFAASALMGLALPLLAVQGALIGLGSWFVLSRPDGPSA